MIRILTIIGARPQIIKAASISRIIRDKFSDQIEEHILHTGQHYDSNMSEVFFRELGIPCPAYNLHVGSGSHGVQTARMIEGIEHVLTDSHYDGMIVYGDTNSTLAAAVAATKMNVAVFHVEAGLRSYNMEMPEEINRIVSDQLSSVLFVPTQTGLMNLQKEGFPVGDTETAMKARHFGKGKRQRVVLSGDVMYDNWMYYSNVADAKSDIIERLELTSRGFVLATIHRPANTDNIDNLRTIIRALSEIAKKEQINVVFPVHPRTRKKMDEAGLLPETGRIRVIDPVSFFEIIRLEKNARVVMTDSGGVQKEAFFASTPCVILRPETEWEEIVNEGAGIITDADYDHILEAYDQLADKAVHFPPLFGDGHASEKIVSEIISYLREEKK